MLSKKEVAGDLTVSICRHKYKCVTCLINTVLNIQNKYLLQPRSLFRGQDFLATSIDQLLHCD
jgi:hypothetical protein